jgi:hypothetical protein
LPIPQPQWWLDSGDMIEGIHLASGTPTFADVLSGTAAIQTALALGHRLSTMKAIGMRSKVDGEALTNDGIPFFKPSLNSLEHSDLKG